jgi:hypothetical protein
MNAKLKRIVPNLSLDKRCRHHPAKCTVRYANTDGPNVERTSEMPARLNLLGKLEKEVGK